MSPWPTVVVEDQVMFRDFLLKLIECDSRFECVGSTGDGAEGLEMCQRLRPRLICLDLNLIGMSGLSMAAKLESDPESCRILALTSCRDEVSISSILELGFAGYVEKDQPISVLEHAMVAVAEGRTYFSPTLDAVRRRMARNPDAISKVLSLREREILALVAEGGTSAEIAGRLEISVRTVGNHRYNIMKKLELKNAAEVVAFALKTSESKTP